MFWRFCGYGVVMVIVFNATFNNISVLSWRLVLLVKETGVPGENRWPVASHRQTYIEYTSPERRIGTHNFSACW
jgi:hypothetical protein